MEIIKAYQGTQKKVISGEPKKSLFLPLMSRTKSYNENAHDKITMHQCVQ